MEGVRIYYDVRDFMYLAKQKVQTTPAIPNQKTKELRMNLIAEELKEVCEAIDRQGLPEITKETIDLIYVLTGTAVSYGINPEVGRLSHLFYFSEAIEVYKDSEKNKKPTKEFLINFKSRLLFYHLELLIGLQNDKLSEIETELDKMLFSLSDFFLLHGLPFHTLWRAVHKNNISKIKKSTRRKDGKINKPENHKKVNIKQILIKSGVNI